MGIHGPNPFIQKFPFRYVLLSIETSENASRFMDAVEAPDPFRGLFDVLFFLIPFSFDSAGIRHAWYASSFFNVASISIC
jgi:hypothetical protein